jgi:hypothetical protein
MPYYLAKGWRETSLFPSPMGPLVPCLGKICQCPRALRSLGEMRHLPQDHNWFICLGNTTRLQTHFVLKEAVLDWLGEHPEDAITVCT